MSENILDFLLDEEIQETPQEEHTPGAWKVMIVDDDPSVHEATKFSLSRFRYLGKGVEWISAYSAYEAKLLLETEKDVAILFLDVVMEEDNAGLEFAKWYREARINPSTRIILRTGQPGQAPEREIIVNYDLHDYKTKTELTSDKLFTTTVSALRAYHDISRLEETKAGLETIIHSTGTIMRVQTMYDYARAVLRQIESILDIRSSGLICAQNIKQSGWRVLAESGRFNKKRDEIFNILDESVNRLGDAHERREADYMVRFLSEDADAQYAIYIEPNDSLSDIQCNMLLMFCNNVSVGLSNIQLYHSLLNANRVTVMSLAQVTESRDHNTGEHVFRIARATDILVKELIARNLYAEEFTPELVRYLNLASTLHDIGKVVVRDSVLLKPGKLTAEEFDEIKQHTVMGAHILDSVINTAGERVEYLELGREIALSHHERWDGTGYPHGIKEREIPLSARITAIVDVFDALTHERCYKPAYSPEEAKSIIIEGRGSFFDPTIVDVFLDVIENIVNAPLTLQLEGDYLT